MKQEYIFKAGILGPETDYRILVTGEIGLREIKIMIRNLELDKSILLQEEALKILDSKEEPVQLERV